MTRSNRLIAATLLALGACGGEAGKPDTAVVTPVVNENDAQRAARIALALQAMPSKQDSVLTANGLTADQLEQLMYKVAQDSSLSAEYGRLTNR